MIYFVTSVSYLSFLSYRPDIDEFARHLGLPRIRCLCTHCLNVVGHGKVMRCKRCSAVYCSKACQITDFDTHKQGVCRAKGVDMPERRYAEKASCLFVSAINYWHPFNALFSRVAKRGYAASGRGIVGILFYSVSDVFRLLNAYHDSKCHGPVISPFHQYISKARHQMMKASGRQNDRTAQRVQERMEEYDPKTEFLICIVIRNRGLGTGVDTIATMTFNPFRNA